MAKKQEILNTAADITKDILIPILLGGPTPSNIWSTIQGYNNNLKSKNIDDCLLILQDKMKNSILDGQLPDLEPGDNNLMLSIFEEMQDTYTQVKRDCISTLVTNMLYEKKNGTFQLYTYQVIFDQLKQMYDPEIMLFKEIYANNETLTCYESSDAQHLSTTELLKLNEYSSYRLKKLENLAFLENITGFIAVDTNGEFNYNKTYFNTFYNKVCSLLYETQKAQAQN